MGGGNQKLALLLGRWFGFRLIEEIWALRVTLGPHSVTRMMMVRGPCLLLKGLGRRPGGAPH